MADLKNEMLSDAELTEKVINIIKKSLEKDEVPADADFTKDLDIDSITKMDLLMNFEDEFNVEIQDEDAAKLVSVNETVKFIKSLKTNDNG